MNTFVLTLTAVAALFLAACDGDIIVHSETMIVTRPSRSQEQFPRGEVVFSCSTISALYEYVDNGLIDPRACRNLAMTAVTYRSSYDSANFGDIDIYQFMVRGGWTYYTFDQSRYRQYRRLSGSYR